MEYWQAIFLGLIQGLTEFLPVSSSGHLVVFQHLLSHDPADPSMLLFDLVVHLGTVLAILLFFRHELTAYVKRLVSSSPRTDPIWRMTLLAILATAVTGGVYVFLGDIIEEGFESVNVVAICWFFTAGLLLVTDHWNSGSRRLRDFSVLAAVLIGLAQGAALFPGVSRSGATICVALLCGMRRQWAAQFSFLIAVPAVCGATLIKGLQFFKAGYSLPAVAPMLVGGTVAALVGLAALGMLLAAVKRAQLKVFAAYCFVAATLALLL